MTLTDTTSSAWRKKGKPIARDDAAKTDEDTAVDIDPLANDFRLSGLVAIEGQVVSTGSRIVLSSSATVSVIGDGEIRYDPSSSEILDSLGDGEFKTETFSYEASGDNGSASARVRIIVTGIDDDPAPENSPPVAVNDFFPASGPIYPIPIPYPVPLEQTTTKAETAEDASLSIWPQPLPVKLKLPVLANDRDADGDTLTIATINGRSVDPGDAIKLKSGAVLRLNDEGTILTYKGGVLDRPWPTPWPADAESKQLSDLAAADTLTFYPGPDPLPKPIPLPDPIPIPGPIYADRFTYQATDGEELSNTASVTIAQLFMTHAAIENEALVFL